MINSFSGWILKDNLLVGGIDQGLQDVIHFVSRSPALLNHLEENILDLSVSSVPRPNQKEKKVFLQ